MASTSSDSSAGSEADAQVNAAAAHAVSPPAIYYDGTSNRKHAVALRFGPNLDLIEGGVALESWSYDDIRKVDGGQGALRLKCLSALPLARLEVSDPAAQSDIGLRARFLGSGRAIGSGHTGRIVVWSLAAIASIVLIVVFGL